MNLFEKMQKMADLLYILIHDDVSIYENKGRFPVQSLERRGKNVHITCDIEDFDLFNPPIVGNATVVEHTNPSHEIGDAVRILAQYRNIEPDEIVYMRGDDWTEFPGKEKVEELGIDIKYVPYTDGVSSTERRNEVNS